MTHIVGIRLTNFERFRGTFELALQPGTYAIIAEREGNPDSSNGLCKSGLLRAIRWALEGYKPRTAPTLDHLISHGESELGVDLELSDGTFISRTKKRDKSVQLHAIFAASDQQELDLYQDAAEQQLWKTIGLTPDDLMSTCIAEQRKLAALVLPPEGKVKSGSGFEEAIHGWLGLEQLVTAGERAFTTLRVTSRKLLDLEKVILLSAASYKDFPQAAIEAEIEQLKQRVVAHEQAVEQRRALTKQREEWLALKGMHDAHANALTELSSLEAQLAALPPKRNDLSNELRARDIVLADASKDYAQKRRLATGNFDGCCPVNQEACPVKEQINSQSAKNARLAQQALEVYETASKAHRTMRDHHREQQEVEKRRTQLTAKIDHQRLAVQEWEAKAVPLGAEPIVDEIASSDAVGYQLRMKQSELLRYQEHLDSIEKQKVEAAALRLEVAIARAAAAVLGPEGAQRRISERAVHAIERAANADLQAAGIDLQLLVRWGRETQKLAEQCPSCGAAYPASRSVRTCETCLAVRGMKVVPDLRFELSTVSGGYEDLGGLALRCAAFKWLRAKRHASWSVSIFDEPFAHLDRAHVRALSAHVQTLLASTFEQSFITAHHASVLDSMPHRIVITGSGKWSTVRVVA